MNKSLFRLATLPLCLMLAHGPVIAQAQPAPITYTQPAQRSYSQEELDRLLAPIALYPDALLSQILMASTYPLEVVKAARWSSANPNVTGPALQDAMAAQDWDPSVKALTAVPRVLDQMNQNIDWTQSLGDAFLAQQQDVMNTIQSLRARAYAAGNLNSGPDMVVQRQVQGPQTIYVIESPNPDVVYVPTYNPAVIYGDWWYPTPPYTMYAPGYVYPASGLVFATGLFVGAAIWANFIWGGGGGGGHYSHVDIDVHRYNAYNRTSLQDSNWHHRPDHRGGVPYRDPHVSQQYGGSNHAWRNGPRNSGAGYGDTGPNASKPWNHDGNTPWSGSGGRGNRPSSGSTGYSDSHYPDAGAGGHPAPSSRFPGQVPGSKAWGGTPDTTGRNPGHTPQNPGQAGNRPDFGPGAFQGSGNQPPVRDSATHSRPGGSTSPTRGWPGPSDAGPRNGIGGTETPQRSWTGKAGPSEPSWNRPEPVRIERNVSRPEPVRIERNVNRPEPTRVERNWNRPERTNSSPAWSAPRPQSRETNFRERPSHEGKGHFGDHERRTNQ